ncbi:Piso0_005663 [Millerozyma farinosa CBS 7064]|uniref:Piso0_005663 protein n=1 Tax=Pichia sorbitophila (strain ATCC MYA-4447 / BCRC 22081 / CBS 7064 / NBRC 10061 / NRRL Y-12695) TaxID=559304 RepID=G8Y2K8_PICSO|nr:Piso0_005663 [Millerozyma farinosa CBS 7064]
MDQVSSFFEHILAADAGVERREDDKSGLETVAKASHDNDAKKTGKRPEAESGGYWGRRSEGDEARSSNTLLTNKLMEKVLSMVIPMDVKHSATLSRRAEMQKSRPALSINVMSRNSILLNQRLSAAFKTIDGVIRFLNWTDPAFTIGVLLVTTHVILRPSLALALPLALTITKVMVPHYMVIHPADQWPVEQGWFAQNPVPAAGPPLHRWEAPRPVPEFSSEFILNLTDLQNHMLLYVGAYDFIIWLTSDWLFFKDEELSSAVYLLLLAAATSNVFMAPTVLSLIYKYVPIKSSLIAAVWCLSILAHPYFRESILSWLYNEDTRVRFVQFSNQIEWFLEHRLVTPPYEDGGVSVPLEDAPPPGAEIFELHWYNSTYRTWEPVGFTTDFYTINCPMRSQDAQPNHDVGDADDAARHVSVTAKESLADIKPPVGWQFSQDNWAIDLDVHEWVTANHIADIVSIDADEKWVYDIESPTIPRFFRRRRWVRRCCRHSTVDTDLPPPRPASITQIPYSDFFI